MSTTATPGTRPRRGTAARSDRAPRSRLAFLLGALAVLAAAAVGLLVVMRSDAATPASGSEHSLGATVAAVTVEEYSDFE
jgi:hypothetical protein